MKETLSLDLFFKVWHCLISYMLLKADLRYQTSFSDIFVNPGTSRCPTVDLELVQTTRNVNGTRHSVRKFQPGKLTHLFRFSTFSGNFTVGRTDETCSIYPRTGNSANFDLVESAQLFTNREFHFCSLRNFRVFFLNGKRPWCPAMTSASRDKLGRLFLRPFRRLGNVFDDEFQRQNFLKENVGAV